MAEWPVQCDAAPAQIRFPDAWIVLKDTRRTFELDLAVLDDIRVIRNFGRAVCEHATAIVVA